MNECARCGYKETCGVNAKLYTDCGSECGRIMSLREITSFNYRLNISRIWTSTVDLENTHLWVLVLSKQAHQNSTITCPKIHAWKTILSACTLNESYLNAWLNRLSYPRSVLYVVSANMSQLLASGKSIATLMKVRPAYTRLPLSVASIISCCLLSLSPSSVRLSPFISLSYLRCLGLANDRN